MSSSSTSGGGSPWKGCSRSSGVRKRLERLDVRRRAGCADQLGARAARGRHAKLDGHALDRDADGAPVLRLDERDDLREPLEAADDLRGILGRRDDGEVLAAVPEAAGVAGRLGAERLGHLVGQRERAVQEQGVPRRLREVPAQRRTELVLRLRADARHLLEAALGGCLAELVERPHAERLADVHRALGAQAEHPGDADEVG